MTASHDPTDPINMTTQERTDELAAILARAVLRLHAHGQPSVIATPAQTPQKSAQSALDCVADSLPDPNR